MRNCSSAMTSCPALASLHAAMLPAPPAPTITTRMNPGKSKNAVFGGGEKNARATGFAPHPMIDAARFRPDVIARIKLLVIDHQFAVEQMQLFSSRVAVRRIVRPRRQAHQHADAVFCRIRGEHFDGDAGRRLFPFRLGGWL